VTTAQELAAIMRYCAFDSPAASQFLEITRTMTYTFSDYKAAQGGNGYQTGSKTVACTNHNAFLQMMDGALTGKTGFTSKAGYCYVGALEQEGKRFTVALLACGWPNHKTWKWHDSRLLFEYGLDTYTFRDIFQEKALEKIPVREGQQELAGLQLERKKLKLLLSPTDQVEIKWQLPETLEAPVICGQQVGEQQYYVNGTLYERVPVYAADTVLKIDYLFCLKKVWKALAL